MRAVARSLAVLLALSLATPAGAVKEKALEFLKRGMVELSAERFDTAIVEFEKGYEEQPDPMFIFNIAQAHRRAKRPGKALDAYRRYLEAAPDAKNRAEVEAQIADLEPAAVAEATPAAATPAAAKPVASPPAATPPPAAAAATPPPATPPAAAPAPAEAPAAVDKPAELPPEVKEAPKEVPAAKPAPPAPPKKEAPKEVKPLFGWKWPVWVGIVGGAFLLGTIITIAAVAGSGPDETGVMWSAR